MESPELTEAVQRTFVLVGDTVVRRATMLPTRVGAGKYPAVGLTLGYRRYAKITLHRVKFFLLHGYWPAEVDHRNVDATDQAGGNLRAATRRQNLANRRLKPRLLPRGVSLIKRSGLARYAAQLTLNKARVYLGSYDTAEAASEAVEALLRQEHGDFYRDPKAI